MTPDTTKPDRRKQRFANSNANKSKRKVATLQSKELAWGKTGKSGCDPNFMWRRHNGELLYPREMKTVHVWNALKVAWSRRLNIKGYGMQRYWKQAVANLYLELCSRPDVTKPMLITLRIIAKRITKR